MLKRPIEVLVLENDDNEANDIVTHDDDNDGEPAAKLIRLDSVNVDPDDVDNDITGQFVDKCIQVDSVFESSPEDVLEKISQTQLLEQEEIVVGDSGIEVISISNHDDIADDDEDETTVLALDDTIIQNNNDESETSMINQQQKSTELEQILTVTAGVQPDEDTEIEFNQEEDSSLSNSSSSSSSGVLSITNSLDDSCTTTVSNTSLETVEKPLRGVLMMSGDGRKSNRKKKVLFNNVTVFYFKRSQGFTCVPSQGGSTLGMENTHSYLKNFTLETHAEERKRAHREILLRQKRFAKINKQQSSTSESDDDESGDEFSDLSDIDLENDSCYFLQPVPIKQRRALLRASGVRKIETTEKEECRDIRMSREFCGCDCRVYCNPDVCACSQAGIKCQVDRMSFPCGCTREGCANVNGRIEFNPLRVRTHFVHTIMRLEMEKKQSHHHHPSVAGGGNPNESVPETTTDSGSITVTTAPNTYLSANVTANGFESAGCSSQMLSNSSSSHIYLPPNHGGYVTGAETGGPETTTVVTHHHHMIDSGHVATELSNNNPELFMNHTGNVMFPTEFSPDNCSSYSENSDYTSDDFEEENYCQTDTGQENSKSGPVTDHSTTYGPSSSSSSSAANFPHHQLAGTGPILPPFPSINCDPAACGVSSSSITTGEFKQRSYQSSNLDHLVGSSYETTTTTGTATYPLPPGMNETPPQQQTYHQSPYDHHPVQYNNYDFHHHHETHSHHQFANNNHHHQEDQQYIDLSLSIASSSSSAAESMLSAANNNSDEDTRLTPVSFPNQHHNHHQHDGSGLTYSSSAENQRQCQFEAETAVKTEQLLESQPTAAGESSSSSSSTSSSLSSSSSTKSTSLPPPSSSTTTENFGEIIKKSIVESVTA